MKEKEEESTRGNKQQQKKLLKNVIRIVFADGHAFFSPAERSLGVGFVSVSSFPIPARPTDSRDVVYTTCPQLESSSRLTSRQVASFQKSFQNTPIEQILTSDRFRFSFQMDLKGGGGGGSIKSDKKRGPVTALLSRQNSKTGRGSTPVSNSDQDSPPVVPDTIDSPLLGRANNNGAGNSISRTSSIRSKQGEPSADRNTSPMPKSRDQTPESGDSIQSTGDSSSLGNKVTGKRLIDSAKKKILWLASKNEWGGLEQAMKTLEQTVAANKNSSELLSPLADIQDEVYI